MIEYTIYFETFRKSFIGTPTTVFDFLIEQDVPYDEANRARKWCEQSLVGDYYQSESFDIETDLVE